MNEILYVGREPPVQADTWLVTLSERTVTVFPPRQQPEPLPAGMHMLIRNPVISLSEPFSVNDDEADSLTQAFHTTFYHFGCNRPERNALLAIYGDLIVCYLNAYYKPFPHLSLVVEQIQGEINLRFRESSWSLEKYLRSLPFSYGYLRTLFQRETGLTPLNYLTQHRLHFAAQLLTQSNLHHTVADIARASGFRDPLYFSRVFKKHYNVAPSDYNHLKGAETDPTGCV